MKRTDASGNASGLFKLAPEPATQIDDTWLNAVQEELATVIEHPTGGDAALDAEDNGQLLAAIKAVVDGKVAAGTGFQQIGDRHEKWGSVRGSVTSETTAAVEFPDPFPTACDNVRAQVVVASAGAFQDMHCQVIASSITRFGFTVQYQAADSDYPLAFGFDWAAKGY